MSDAIHRTFMNAAERARSELARAVVDDALRSFGEPVMALNPHFNSAGLLLDVYPMFAIDKPGVAPFRFVFGRDFEVWVGSHSEVVLVDVGRVSHGQLLEVIVRVLRSSVSIRCGRFLTTVSLRCPDQERPWLRLRIRARGAIPDTDQDFVPFAP